MPQIHVVYDPNDRISATPPDMMAKLGISVAILRLDEPLTNERTGHIANDLVNMLLKQMALEPSDG